ncbi:MAG: alpha/beta fold hydrolase [Candidatus Lernaella stagnicola]|nr:alpha/beta fold hydrolase [Candidatus Lernaella stagnicola]
MIGTIILWLVAIVAIAMMALYVAGRLLFRKQPLADQILFALTDDDRMVAIWRFLPKGDTPKKIPVILQHGLGANHLNFDMHEEVSLCRYLAARGYDVFAPDLRSGGLSLPRKWGAIDRWNIRFEHFVEQDLPAVFAEIQRATGRKKVHYVGHSMGGLIGYALAEGEYGKRMQSLTAVAGPAIFGHMQQFRSLLPLRPLMRPFKVIHQRLWTTIIALPAYLWPRFAGTNLVNPENVTGKTVAIAAVNALENMPRDLLLQFAQWVEHRQWGSEREEPYEELLDRITCPIYCLGGPVDHFCPPGANESIVDRVSSRKKQYRMFSRANGDLADYGHGDLIIGITAPREIFTSILAWLQDNE